MNILSNLFFLFYLLQIFVYTVIFTKSLQKYEVIIHIKSNIKYKLYY